MREVAKLADVPTFYREALATHDILGMFVDTRCIFVSLTDDGDLLVVVREGEREAAVRVGRLVGTREEFESDWDLAVAAYNASPKEERREMLLRSRARDKAPQIIASMVSLGFRVGGGNPPS